MRVNSFGKLSDYRDEIMEGIMEICYEEIF